MTLKILACSSSLDGGGSERQLWQLVCNLPASDFNCELFLIYKRGPYLDRLPSGMPVHAFSDVTLSRSGLRGRLPGSINRAQIAYLTELVRRRAVDVIYDRTYHMTLITGQASRQTKRPRVSVIVSPPSYDFKQGRERFKWFKFRVLRRAYSDPRSRTICVSQAVADDAAEFYQLPYERFRVIQSPVDIDNIVKQSHEPLADEFTAENVLKASGPRLRIVVVGRMTAEKGHEKMIDFAKHWKTLEGQSHWLPIGIDFIGDGPLAGELQAKVHQSGLTSQIRFCGFQSNPYPWIARADIVCIPSLYEGLPNIALEAMALRRPLIATQFSPALKALLGNCGERGGLIDPSDPASISQAVLSILREKQRTEECCEAAFEWVSQNHSIHKWMEEMSELFVDLVAAD